ncbi:DUF500-domain-containing protein [Tilletiaria anomala UBC 951]|uniref:DUF500-domain-containing protein n=1 Tax=Tilletiaria anomala (strain ATCC 24038 / CBS 436.72 / UBC 951) TaxID=1037660 RepID=A0A066W868_TILAU|nr:DUF500-domain-containing protein [Tilletiaria anomala UBC 951]KDN46960.1 DUF500-domain-containing protein [Tilletiaria anomala UBC 951]
MSNYLNKFKDAAHKAGVQATAFAQQTSRQLSEQAKLAQAGFSLPKECDKASKILQSFLADPEHPDSALNAIPKAVLQQAKGLAVFSVIKAGFIWSGKAGSGVVTARLPDGTWSAPSCIATGGVGFGFQIGADISDFVVVMNSEDAVRSFGMAGNLTLGGSLSATAGPIGTGGAVQAAVAHPAPMFSYSRSKGLFAGISLEGVVLVERKDANREFYGQAIPARDLLAGKVPPPEAASAMYEVIEAAEQIDESGVPQQAYVPGAPSSEGYTVGGSQRASALNGSERPIFDASAHTT